MQAAGDDQPGLVTVTIEQMVGIGHQPVVLLPAKRLLFDRHDMAEELSLLQQRLRDVGVETFRHIDEERPLTPGSILSSSKGHGRTTIDVSRDAPLQKGPLGLVVTTADRLETLEILDDSVVIQAPAYVVTQEDRKNVRGEGHLSTSGPLVEITGDWNYQTLA